MKLNSTLTLIAVQYSDLSVNMFVGDAVVASGGNVRGGLLTKHTTRCTTSQLRQSERPFNFKLVPSSASYRDTQSFRSVSTADKETVSGVGLNASHPSADDSSLMAASLDTSALRRSFSDLDFDLTLEPKDVRWRAKSASASILSRYSSMDVAKPVCSPPKPKVQKLRRRKQEFDQLLQTPPGNYQTVEQRTSLEHRKSEADSGFGSESGNSAIESELKVLMEDGVIRSRTPLRQIRVRSPICDVAEIVAPGSGDDTGDAEEDMNLMLFTPFKIVNGCNELPELSPDIELSASIVAGSDSWASFTPISTGSRARTSTPCRLLGTTPENRSKRGISGSDSITSPRLSHLLSEFEDNGICVFDGVTGSENTVLSDLTSSGVLTLDEAVELDVKDLSFGEL